MPGHLTGPTRDVVESTGTPTRPEGFPVDITVYLPDEIGKRAKDAALPFSRMLRDAVTAQLDYRDTLTHATGGMTPHKIDTANGERAVQLQFTGRRIASDADCDGDLAVYQTDTGTIVVADPESYSVHDDAEAFGAWLQDLQDPHRDDHDAWRETVLLDAAEELGLP